MSQDAQRYGLYIALGAAGGALMIGVSLAIRSMGLNPLAAPHGSCLLWNRGLIVPMALFNLAILAAYAIIPVQLLRFRTLSPLLTWLFAGFIWSCGLTHLMDMVTLFYPAYGAQIFVLGACASLSVATVIVLFRVLGKPGP